MKGGSSVLRYHGSFYEALLDLFPGIGMYFFVVETLPLTFFPITGIDKLKFKVISMFFRSY